MKYKIGDFVKINNQTAVDSLINKVGIIIKISLGKTLYYVKLNAYNRDGSRTIHPFWSRELDRVPDYQIMLEEL